MLKEKLKVYKNKELKNMLEGKVSNEGVCRLKYQSLITNDELMLREGGKYSVWRDETPHKVFYYIVNDERVRVPLKQLEKYINEGTLVKLEIK